MAVILHNHTVLYTCTTDGMLTDFHDHFKTMEETFKILRKH